MAGCERERGVEVYAEGVMGSRRGKKAIRDELASEERYVEQWHHEERFIGILGASVRLQSRSPRWRELVLRTFSFECDGAAAVRVPLRLVNIVCYTILRLQDPAGREFPTT